MKSLTSLITLVALTAAVAAPAVASVAVYTSKSAYLAATTITHTAGFEVFAYGPTRNPLTEDGITFSTAGAIDLYITPPGSPLTQNTQVFPTTSLSADGDENFDIRLASGQSFGAIGMDYITNRFGPPAVVLYGSGGQLIGSFLILQGPETLGFFGLISTTPIGYARTVVDRGYISDSALDNVRIGFGVSGTPEPAAWAMMLAGFGLVGCALRSRRPAMTQLS